MWSKGKCRRERREMGGWVVPENPVGRQREGGVLRQWVVGLLLLCCGI